MAWGAVSALEGPFWLLLALYVWVAAAVYIYGVMR